MCTFFDEIAKEGEIKGRAGDRAEGIVEVGLDLGLSQNDILDKLQNKLGVSFQKAQEYFKMFAGESV